ncbi:hypothetical protein DSL72_004865 [Monilinia vaccinii-corymbosi]|uniref:RNA polymerase II subunit B1 CTD phosphatase RPAP2 homolog n=1 Tax=Monilinia vaccinii-corymbosi TaxID=61207 RepID=A0A8A3NXU7_9HELO|nr:hypothetical protein DSL72_004865 [Monilinia vaccinii-corymbosi]
MATPQTAKPISKKKSTTTLSPPNSPNTNSTTTTTSNPNTTPNPHLATALHHALLLQERKAIEQTILTSTETLIDYPLAPSPPHNATNPSPADTDFFKRALRPFQPSDYDALIVERNLDSRCGYTLCPNPRPRDDRGGRWRLLGTSGKAKDFRIARREDAERWCSEMCARRALYVRVQLSECPAWERSGDGATMKIDLLDEPKTEEDWVMDGIGNLDLNEKDAQDRERKYGNLALERGETGPGSGSSKSVTNFSIVEREVKQGDVKPPTFDSNELSDRMDTLHLDLEGHRSTFNHGANYGDLFGEDNDDTDMDTDWKI